MTPLTNRFDSIEEAQEYIRLLAEVVDETRDYVNTDLTVSAGHPGLQRAHGLRLVDYKLSQLRDHLRLTSRLLNDLRTLRRVLYGERDGQASTGDQTSSEDLAFPGV